MCQPQVRQQAELLAPRQHLRREAGRDAHQPDGDGHCLQVVRNGKAAVEDAQRQLPQFAAGGEFQQARVGQQCAQALLHGGGLGTGLQPQGQVVDAAVAGEAPVVGVGHGHGAELAHVVAPHAEHTCRHGSAGQGQGDRAARGAAVQGHHGFADVHRHFARLQGAAWQRRGQQGQCRCRVGQRPRDERHAGPSGCPGQGLLACGFHAGHAGQGGSTRCEVRWQPGLVGSAAAARAAGVQVGGQHTVQPAADAVAEARHHHRQRHRQRQAGHHACHRRGGGAALEAGAAQRQQGQRAARRGPGPEQPVDQRRDQRHASEQQGGHGRVGRQGQAGNGRCKGRCGPQQQERHARPERRRVAQRLAQALQCLGRSQCLRLARRPPAADECRSHAEQCEDQRVQHAHAQRRHDAGEVAATQVACQQAQRRGGHAGAHEQAQRAAGQAQQRALGQHPSAALAGTQAQHAQQGEGRGALRHRQRHHAEHQEGTHEQRHQGQHREVHAVGAGQVGDTLFRLPRRRRCDAGRQRQAFQQRGHVGARHQAQVDAGEPAQGVKALLRAGQVHHDHRRATTGHPAGHAQRGVGGAGLQLQRLARLRAQAVACGGVGEDDFRVQEDQAVLAGQRLRHQGRRQRRSAQGVQAQHAHRHALAIGSAAVGVDFQQRAGPLHGGVGRHAVEQGVVNAAAAQRQVRVPVGGAHGGRELRQRRTVDQVHGKRERHTQRHSHQRSRMAPGVVPPFAAHQQKQQGQIQGQGSFRPDWPWSPPRLLRCGLPAPPGW